MRILKILNSNDDGGVFTCEKQFLQEFHKEGVEVDAVILGEGPRKTQYTKLVNRYISISNLNVRFSGGYFNIFRSIFKAFRFGRAHSKNIKRWCKEFDYDAVVYRRANLLFLGGFLGKSNHSVTFWHMPNIISNTFSYVFYNSVFRIFNITPIANSRYTRSTVGKLCSDVIYPGFDEARLLTENQAGTDDDLRSKLGIGIDKMVFGIIARVTPDKAQDIVVKAFLNSDAMNKGDAYLIIAGGLEEEDFVSHIKGIAGDYLNKNIFLVGRIDNVSGFYNAVDVVINGRRNAEPFGISIAEAMGAGKPVLAYYLGGPSEMIVDGEGGWLSKYPTVDGYLEAFNRCTSAFSQWKDIGLHNKRKSSTYSAKVNVEKFIEIIQSAK